MKKLKELYDNYIKSCSKVSFYAWLQGEYEDLNQFAKEIGLQSEELLKSCCKSITTYETC